MDLPPSVAAASTIEKPQMDKYYKNLIIFNILQ